VLTEPSMTPRSRISELRFERIYRSVATHLWWGLAAPDWAPTVAPLGKAGGY
jgi:hypothetical protein